MATNPMNRKRVEPTRLIALALIALPAPAQPLPSTVPPKQEVRAVWVTTTAGLDWPKSVDRANQQSSLKEIVRQLHAAHFNTIFFQVRARGDAYYESSFE